MSPELKKRMQEVAGGYSKYLFKWGNDDKAYRDYIKGAEWMYQDQVVTLLAQAEKLAKALDRLQKTVPVNFKDPDYLIEAKQALAEWNEFKGEK